MGTTERKRTSTETQAPFVIGGHTVDAGTQRIVEIPVSVMSDNTPVSLSAVVIHGRRPGPTVFVCSAVHGDEVLGVEIIRRLLRSGRVSRIAGTLIAVPIVNTFGFIAHSRYLPDRRDLNRTFPGSERGSLAARLAYLFFNEIVLRCDFGIDLHTAAIHRFNLPQVRVSPGSERAVELARAFGAPVTIVSPVRDGSLRGSAEQRGVDMLLYEGGEGLRFDELAIRAGVTGCLRVFRELGMIPERSITPSRNPTMISQSSRWLRAPAGGIVRAMNDLGSVVDVGDTVATIADPFGNSEQAVVADVSGLVIGRSNLPVVNEGDALVHVARIDGETTHAERRVESMNEQLESDPLFDEDEII